MVIILEVRVRKRYIKTTHDFLFSNLWGQIDGGASKYKVYASGMITDTHSDDRHFQKKLGGKGIF